MLKTNKIFEFEFEFELLGLRKMYLLLRGFHVSSQVPNHTRIRGHCPGGRCLIVPTTASQCSLERIPAPDLENKSIAIWESYTY